MKDQRDVRQLAENLEEDVAILEKYPADLDMERCGSLT